MSLTAGLGSFDPNTLPMDAFSLSGGTSDSLRIIGLKSPWVFGTAIASEKWTSGVMYSPGDVVYYDEDGLVYMNLVSTDTIEPDYSDAGVEGVTWKWVIGSIGGFVSGRGWWTKFADGKLVQEGEITVNGATPVAIGALYRSNAGFGPLYPVEFYSIGTFQTCMGRSGADGTIAYGGFPLFYDTVWDALPLDTVPGHHFCCPSSWSTINIKSRWIAIGRWKP